MILLAILVESACLWIPGYPPDKAEPAPDPSDPPGSSHCSPHAGGPWRDDPTRPVLLEADTGARRFHCRITEPDLVTWTIRPVGLAERSDYILASGVSRIDLQSDALPWAPHPYKADLELAVRAGGNQQITSWPLIVLPHGDEFFLPLSAPLESATPNETPDASGPRSGE